LFARLRIASAANLARPSGEIVNMGGMIRFVDSPPVSNSELNELFFASWESWEARDFQPTLKRSLGHICAYDEKRLIGFVNVAGDGGLHAFLLDVTVHPDVQRQGIGKQLVKEAVRLARASGAEYLHVDFEPALAPFYLKTCAFERTEAGLIRL
jgi:ribosomal protein S18 acetylase RimI-like enzyme